MSCNSYASTVAPKLHGIFYKLLIGFGRFLKRNFYVTDIEFGGDIKRGSDADRLFHFGVGDRDEMFNLYTNYGTQDTMGFGVQYNIATTTNISAHASGTTTTQSLVDGNNYMHFVYTCNGPTVNFYINGSLFSTNTNTSYSFGSATRSFNALGRSSKFDEIGGFIFATYKYCRIYNTALSSTQAATLYNNRDSLNHLPFDTSGIVKSAFIPSLSGIGLRANTTHL